MDKLILTSLAAAFFGAFFAFLFLRIAEFFTEMYKRKKKHYNALVRTQYLFNEIMDEINGNLYEIDQIVLAYETAKNNQNTTTIITPNRAEPLTFDKSILLDLVNIDLINELFSYMRKINRINQDIKRTTEMYDLFKNAFIQNPEHKDNYLINFEAIVKVLKVIKDFHIALQERTKRIVCISRIRMRKDKTIQAKFYKFFTRKHHEKNFETLVNEEMKKLNTEIDSVWQESTKEIEKVLSKEKNAK